MVNRLVKILIALFLFFPFIFPQNTFAAVTVQITSVTPKIPKVGEEFSLSVKVTGLEGKSYFYAKVDLGIALEGETYDWYSQKDRSKLIRIFDPASGEFRECGYYKEWAKDCAKFVVSSATWEGKITAIVPDDFPVGKRVVKVRIRREGVDKPDPSDPFSLDGVLPITEDPPQDTTQPPPLCPSGISLSEFMAYPENGKEWVEIYNSNSSSVSLVGWKIDDLENGGEPPVFLADVEEEKKNIVEISAKSYYVRDISDFFNNGTGDWVRLLCSDSIVIEKYSYDKVKKGLSWAKGPDGNWYETTTPTKERENEITPPEIKEEKKAEFTKTSENEVFAQTQSAGSSAALGESSENTETEGDILPDSASDFRPEKPPVWGVKGEVEATASQKIEEASSEASRSAGKDFSKKMIGGGALLSLGSLFYIVLTKFKQIPKKQS